MKSNGMHKHLGNVDGTFGFTGLQLAQISAALWDINCGHLFLCKYKYFDAQIWHWSMKNSKESVFGILDILSMN